MIQTYKFFGENSSLEFDDSKTVKELIQYAFEQFDYYEPFGMETVTIYQSGHAHFTLDTSRKCYEEIKDPNGLYFAYYIPGFLYYAEGGCVPVAAGNSCANVRRLPCLLHKYPTEKTGLDIKNNTKLIFNKSQNPLYEH